MNSTKKILNILILTVIMTNQTSGQQLYISDSILFKTTLSLLGEKNKEPGIRDEIITNNVVNLVYHRNDSIIKLVEKIDLIILVNKLERYAYRVLCNKITNDFETDSTIKHANPLLLIPFCDCILVKNPILIQLESFDSIAIMHELEGLPQNYKFFYESLIKQMLKQQPFNKHKDNYRFDYFHLIHPFESYYLKKYPYLFR